MFSRPLRCLSVFILIALLVGSLSCARDQELLSIAIQPATETFGAEDIPVIANAGASVQLRALGTYAHPPVTKDITDQVTWDSNTSDLATVSSTGLLAATGSGCGSGLVSATVRTNSAGSRDSSGAIVTGYMTASVVCFKQSGATDKTLTVTFGGTGAGTITSSPVGLGCSTSCSGVFPQGTAVTLTATPNGSVFGGWAGCDSVSGQVCTLVMTSDRTVAVNFI